MSLLISIKKQLERDEGRHKDLYYDTLNIPTIGIGRNLKRGLSEDEVDYLFKNDYETHLWDLTQALPWAKDELDEVRFGALLNMYFNLGPKLLGFTSTLAALKDHRWEDAANHALNSVWASQVKGRANRIAKQFITGEWQ